MPAAAQHKTVYLLFLLAITCNVLIWLHARHIKSEWLNVPPVPSDNGIVAFNLGDDQMAYRSTGIMLQNIGDTGGNSTHLKDYDYQHLTDWFYLSDRLDPKADFIPMLAAFYFGAVEDPEKLRPLVGYLHKAGKNTEGEKWRWLAQAIYLTRYKIQDTDKAYEMALELASLNKENMPAWTKQMPAFIKNAEGDKQAAYDIMVETMRSGKGKISAVEMNFMQDYICTRILEKSEADKNPLCQDIKP